MAKVKIKVPSGWKYQVVNPRMRKACQECGKQPEGSRLVLQVDSYPYPTTKTFCAGCGIQAMKNKVMSDAELVRLFEDHVRLLSMTPPIASE